MLPFCQGDSVKEIHEIWVQVKAEKDSVGNEITGQIAVEDFGDILGIMEGLGDRI